MQHILILILCGNSVTVPQFRKKRLNNTSSKDSWIVVNSPTDQLVSITEPRI